MVDRPETRDTEKKNFVPGENGAPVFRQPFAHRAQKFLGLDPVKRHGRVGIFEICVVALLTLNLQRFLTTPPTTTIIDNIATMADDTPVTLRTRKFIRNPLLGRKQMVV